MWIKVYPKHRMLLTFHGVYLLPTSSSLKFFYQQRKLILNLTGSMNVANDSIIPCSTLKARFVYAQETISNFWRQNKLCPVNLTLGDHHNVHLLDEGLICLLPIWVKKNLNFLSLHPQMAHPMSQIWWGLISNHTMTSATYFFGVQNTTSFFSFRERYNSIIPTRLTYTSKELNSIISWPLSSIMRDLNFIVHSSFSLFEFSILNKRSSWELENIEGWELRTPPVLFVFCTKLLSSDALKKMKCTSLAVGHTHLYSFSMKGT